MKIVALSDTHGRHENLRVPKGDTVLHAGDITLKGEKREIEAFIDWFGALPHKHKIFIAGNHDYWLETDRMGAIKKRLPPNVHYLKDEEVVLDGVKFWGSPYTPGLYRWAFAKRRGAGLATHWQKIPTDVDVLLTHGPVYGILDLLSTDQLSGDKDLLQRVLAIKPKAHVCGHIHEGYGYVRRHGVSFFNASLLNERYELTNKPLVFDVKKQIEK